MAHSHNCLAQRIQLADAVTCFTLDGDDHDDDGDDDVKEVDIVPQQSVFEVGNNGPCCHKSRSITKNSGRLDRCYLGERHVATAL